MHTRGGRINVNINICISANDNLLALAVGGQERGTWVLDVETGAVVWRAKNLPQDPRMLLQGLMWTTLIAFLCPSGGRAGNGAMMACRTVQSQVQIYNVRSSLSVRHPASGTPEGMLCHRMMVMCQLGPGGG